MPREVSGIRCLALGSGDRLFIGTVDNNIWCTFLNGNLDSPLKESGPKLVKVMEVSSTSFGFIYQKTKITPEFLQIMEYIFYCFIFFVATVANFKQTVNSL